MDVFVTSSFNSLLWHRRSEEAGELVKLLLEVDFRFARQLRLDDLSSYLSTSHRARFFRNLARAFPSLLDTLCSTDEKLKEQIAGLQRSICFMCDCCAQSEAKRGRAFHSLLYSWQLGPIFELLVAGTHARAFMDRFTCMLYVSCRASKLGDDDLAVRASAAIDSDDRIVLGQLLEALCNDSAKKPALGRASVAPIPVPIKVRLCPGGLTLTVGWGLCACWRGSTGDGVCGAIFHLGG
jgi:hypothetical protein